MSPLSTEVAIADYVAGWRDGPFADVRLPWVATMSAAWLVADRLNALAEDYRIADEVAVHRTATVEPGAVVKGPAIIGPRAFVAAHAYLRGGVHLGEGAIVGPSCELKSVFLGARSTVAHLSFVGDSIVGEGVNIEAGAVIANHRNEWADPRILIAGPHGIIDTGVERFGALVGDSVRIGANAVIAPGALLARGSVVARLALIDQQPRQPTATPPVAA